MCFEIYYLFFNKSTRPKKKHKEFVNSPLVTVIYEEKKLDPPCYNDIIKN